MKNKKGMILIAIILGIAVFSAGCMKKVQEKIGTKIGEKVLEKALGEDIKIDTKDGLSISTEGGSMQAGEDLKWPADSMQSIPEPRGKIISIFESTDDDSTTIMFETKEHEANSYYEKLKDMGYIEIMQNKAVDMSMYTLVKDDNTHVFFYDYTSSNSGMIVFGRNSNISREYFEGQQESALVSEEPLEVDMSDSMEWPKDSMNNIPELKAKITSISTSNEYVFIEYQGVNKQDISQYIEKVKSIGFTEDIYEFTSKDSINFSGANSDKFIVNVLWGSNNGNINYIKPTE